MFHYPGSKTILCIDDDDGMLRYQKALFERRGFKVLTASSARQGIRIAAACTVAAVVVDYHMPEMNGHEVALEIELVLEPIFSLTVAESRSPRLPPIHAGVNVPIKMARIAGVIDDPAL